MEDIIDDILDRLSDLEDATFGEDTEEEEE